MNPKGRRPEEYGRRPPNTRTPEDIMKIFGKSWSVVVTGFLVLGLAGLLGAGAAAADRRKVQEQVVTEYLLEQAGFEKWRVNQTTPQGEALLRALPKRTLVIYRRDGKSYHAYGDHDARIIYVGDEAAFNRYLSLAETKNLCERREGGNSEQFWSCFEEMRLKKDSSGK